MEADEELVVIQPLEAAEFSVRLVEFNEFMNLGHWVEPADFCACNDAAKILVCLSAARSPLDVRGFSLHNETVVWCVSLVVRNCQHLVSRAGDKVSFDTPISMSDLFAVL